MTDSALFFTNGGIALTAIWYQGQLAVFCCNFRRWKSLASEFTFCAPDRGLVQHLCTLSQMTKTPAPLYYLLDNGR